MAHSEVENTAIPVIDISKPSDEVARQVLEAASTHGFLFIQNDGVTIPPKDINDMFKLSEKFFSSSDEQKAAYAIHSDKAGGTNRGWVKMAGESLDPEGQKQGDPKEAFNIGPPQPHLQPLPSPLSTSSSLILRFQNSCHALCTSILSLLGTALETPDPSYFASRHDQTLGPSGTIFRMLYYPSASTATKEDDRSIRAGAHSDYGSLTLLFRVPGQPGLELFSPKNQTWVPVPVNPSPSTLSHPPILVNIGDLLSFWTGGMLKSTVHRVTFSGGGERYSMAYFCHPLDDAKLERVESRVLAQADGKMGREELRSQRKRLGLKEDDEEVLTAKEHLDRRLRVTYGL
ncbi:Clavaminate synthase-like protein [Macroventuria anomochaeta]|uniref:Clavaminate synthase-like protein n=1 Tax=Macroventuria anomochaeta TaxID=301207 RepID=A0ACB6SGF3_9PLEO|nr:Clavaminate synthase-like protein [Macroventuria anomochaeta]KAF2633078.1 Clavaminate synthase-like protein [Macroventuria anomochaeta]